MFSDKSIAVFINKIKHVYFLFVNNVSLPLWELQLIFLKQNKKQTNKKTTKNPHPNSVAVWNSI